LGGTLDLSSPGAIGGTTAAAVNATTVTASGIVSGLELTSTASSGDEGGQINLAKAVTNTTLATGITIDVWKDRLRIFETGSPYRGAYIDLSTTSNGAGTNLLAGGGGSASAAGSDQQLQFNSAGAFGASSSLTWDGSYLVTTGLNFRNVRETIYSNGTISGTFAPNATNGSVQSVTFSGGSITINGFASPVAGQSITLIMTMSGAGYTLSSTMKFAGGQKTISTIAGSIDIMTIYYDGTNYYASLAKGFV
jgi:hypothetical protein